MAIPVIAGFGVIDATFVASNSLKIIDGGWFSLTTAGVILVLMLCWHRGSYEVRRRLQDMPMPLEQFVGDIDQKVVARTPGVGVWLTKVEHGVSPVMLHHVKNNCVMHRTVILFTVLSDERPRVPFGERLAIEKLGHGFYRIQLRLGFMQTPNIPRALEQSRSHGFDVALDDVHYYVAHEYVARRETGSAMWRESFAIFAFLTKIASRAPDFFKIPLEGRSEVGFRVEI